MFFTEVKIDRTPGVVAHGEKIWTIGSCFADETGCRMADGLFDIRVNPCGTLYNPLSIAGTLQRIADGRSYGTTDIFCHNGLWHCMDFHSSFSAPDPATVLSRINSVVTTLHAELPKLRLLTLTLGSARAFIDRTTGQVAGNCHKLPAARFEVHDLGIDTITEALHNAINSLRAVSPELKIILTVSPIRHKAYGFHADRISKATLLLAAEQLCATTGAHYFPAYEIMNDELRDYRFYAADMIHPSEVACNHIYNRFAEAFFSEETRRIASDGERLTRRLRHRQLNPSTAEAAAFRQETIKLLEELKARNPVLATAIDNSLNRTIH